MPARTCYAPVFSPASAMVCAARATAFVALLILLILILALSGGSESVLCLMRQVVFRLQHCREGNTDPRIDLTPDPYRAQVRYFKRLYAKSNEWEQWMLDNRSRYENVYLRARDKPAVLNIAFRYDSAPIAYNPPWANESEHMAALAALAEPAYAGYDFNFIFAGDTSTSYANVIAGIPTNGSYASGRDVFLYYETIFNHEFGHVMGVPHHYNTPAETGTGQRMPPGETRCIMDRNSNQYCSACRTALCIPLDVNNDAAISAAAAVIMSRYPY